MKKLIILSTIIFYGLIVPLPADSALVDATATPWDFNARIFDGALGFHSTFDDSLLVFDEQTPKSGGGAFLAGEIFWDVGGSTVAVTDFVGELFADGEFVLIGSTGGLLTAFRGIFADDDLLLGELGGFGGSDLHGFFWATPVDLPPSNLLMLFALGSLLVVGGVRRRRG